MGGMRRERAERSPEGWDGRHGAVIARRSPPPRGCHSRPRRTFTGAVGHGPVPSSEDSSRLPNRDEEMRRRQKQRTELRNDFKGKRE